VRRLVLIIFFLEIGFVLTLAPWSAFWDRNYFAETVPLVQRIVTNNFVRGAVTGLGVINVCAAIADLVGMFLARSAAPSDVAIAEPSADQ
jgi:hypothetical protein